jgi:hypothetical protein
LRSWITTPLTCLVLDFREGRETFSTIGAVLKQCAIWFDLDFLGSAFAGKLCPFAKVQRLFYKKTRMNSSVKGRSDSCDPCLFILVAGRKQVKQDGCAIEFCLVEVQDFERCAHGPMEVGIDIKVDTNGDFRQVQSATVADDVLAS